MQFNTKRGLVDIPNEEIIAAARTLGLSAGPTPDQQGHCERSRLATGSLPVFDAECLAKLWEGEAYAIRSNATRPGNLPTLARMNTRADQLELCAMELRLLMARTNQRQPEENNVHETTRRTDPSQRTDRSE